MYRVSEFITEIQKENKPCLGIFITITIIGEIIIEFINKRSV